MARNPDRVLSRLTVLGCPFCLDATSNALTDGAQAGALVLVLVAAVVVAGFVRFAWRLARAERSA